MKQEKTFENVKFSQVPLQKPSRSGRKKYFWLALIVTKVIILALIPGGIIYYKAYAYNKKNEKEWLLENETFTSKINFNYFENLISIFNTDQWSLEKKNLSNLTSEFPYCEESWNSLESIPSVYKSFISNTQSICRTNFKTFINVDILLVFDRIINKYSVKSLKSIFAEYHKKLSSVNSVKDFIQFINALDSNKIKFYIAHMEEYEWDRYLQVSDFHNVISLVKELSYWYQYLDSLEGFLANYEQQKQREIYRKIITEKNFSFFVRETQRNLPCAKYDFIVTEKKVQEINIVISQWTKETSIEKNEAFLIVSNKRLLISEVKDKLKNDSAHQNICIFASHSLILDEDLELPGINIALIAPVWIFRGKIKINLNGVDGKSFSVILENGRPGKPGYPGGHGGDFLGIGDADFGFLNVSAKGGKGGPGQDGQTGVEGLNFTKPGFFKTPKCILESKTYHEALNFGTKYYKIFDERGCGKDGTDGGVGGLGGKGGMFLMMNKSSEKLCKGLDGTLGIPGKGGKGGRGSAVGCYYEAASINGTMIPVTKFNCLYDTVLPSGKSGNDDANFHNQLQPSKKINLNFSDVILKFYQFAVANLENNHVLLSFLTDQTMWKPSLIHFDMLKKFKAIDNLKKLKMYELFQQEIHLISQNNSSRTLNFLMALTKGKILVVKHDINYSFMDLNNYLIVIQQNIEDVKSEPTGKYQTSLLKSKLDDKLHKININLKNLRSTLQFLSESIDNTVKSLLEKISRNIDPIQDVTRTEDLIKSLQERRLVHIMEIIVEIMNVYAKKISLGYLTEKEDIEFKNFASRQMLTFNTAEKRKEELLNSFSEFPTNERIILSLFIASEMEIKKYKIIFKKIVKFLPDSSKEERELIDAVEKISVNGIISEKRKETVENLKEAIFAFGDSFSCPSELKILIEKCIESIQHLIDMDKLLLWCESEQEFKKSVDNLFSETVDWKNEKYELLKNELNQVIVEIYYKLAVDAVGRKVWPFLKLTRHLQPTGNRTAAEEALIQIHKLRQIIRSPSFCRNKHRAFFSANSTVGEFYLWPNDRIQSKIKKLFQGLPIDIKADINNHHVLDKNFVRVKTLRLEFVCREYENSQECKNTFLDNIIHFKVELTHSGYSLFNWKGDVFTIVSDELTLDFSLKTEKNGEPEFYNTIFKGLEHGQINVSPYTTWKIQLKPVNPLADFAKLMPFASHIDLRLVGIGTFFT